MPPLSARLPGAPTQQHVRNTSRSSSLDVAHRRPVACSPGTGASRRVESRKAANAGRHSGAINVKASSGEAMKKQRGATKARGAIAREIAREVETCGDALKSSTNRQLDVIPNLDGTFTVEILKEEIGEILFDRYDGVERKPTIYVSGVRPGGKAQGAGVYPGQILRGIEDGRGDMWYLTGNERVMFVKDMLRLCEGKSLLILDEEPKITAEMVQRYLDIADVMKEKTELRKERNIITTSTPELYSDDWDGDVYIGSRWNIMTVLLAITFFLPVLGILYAFASGRIPGYNGVWPFN